MDTPLNKAHFYARRSMQFSSDQKIQYIEKAIENFSLALSQTTNAKAIESIEYQKTFYEKQLVLLNFKKNFKSQKIGKQKDDDSSSSSAVPAIQFNEHVVKATNIQIDLFKNIEASDALIDELKRVVPDNDAQSTLKMTEIQNLNSQFNDLFNQLLTCVEETLNENEQLKERLRTLDNSKQDDASQRSEDIRREKEITRESSDSSPEDMQELPPLEFPEFNLDSLGK